MAPRSKYLGHMGLLLMASTSVTWGVPRTSVTWAGNPASACYSDGKHRTRHCILGGLLHTSGTMQMVADPMPAPVNTILLQEEFETWDEQRSVIMQAFLKELLGFQYFPHARDTFANHLRGTWGILQAWGQPIEICRCGLFHTAYGGDLFIFSTLNPFQAASSRERLREIVGGEAEELTWDFGTLARSLVNATLFQARNAELPASMMLNSFVGSPENRTARHLAKIMVVTMADFMDQLVEINLWRDFHSHEPPSLLYPGQMKPEVALYWISRVCKGIREHLDVIPPIFDDCTSEISYETEKEARDLYWEATTSGSDLGPAIQTELLQSAVQRNPFIAEPRVYLAELAFTRSRFDTCADNARKALNLFYQMGTHWDKRLPYRQWISHSRLLLLRCTRLMEGKTSMPVSEGGVVLTTQLVEEMERVSPIARPKVSEGPCHTANSSEVFGSKSMLAII